MSSKQDDSFEDLHRVTFISKQISFSRLFSNTGWFFRKILECHSNCVLFLKPPQTSSNQNLCRCTLLFMFSTRKKQTLLSSKHQCICATGACVIDQNYFNFKATIQQNDQRENHYKETKINWYDFNCWIENDHWNLPTSLSLQFSQTFLDQNLAWKLV